MRNRAYTQLHPSKERSVLPTGYDLDTQLSATKFSQVWTATNSAHGTVALKIAPNNERVEKRFHREILALKAAAGPHSMPVIDHDDTYGWYAMPLAERSLADDPAPASLDAAIAVLEAIAHSLNPIHKTGQVHRDLKPQNILWLNTDSAGRWVVADFGIVRNIPGMTTVQLTAPGGLLGTLGWAAPEQHSDAHKATAAADIYGAGAVLSWILTGIAPIVGHVELPSNPAIRAVIRRATEMRPSHRYATFDDLLAALTACRTAKTRGLKVLIEERHFADIGAYILGHADSQFDASQLLPALDRDAIITWYDADPGGLIQATHQAYIELATERSGLTFAEIDRFLIWGVDVLQVLLKRGDAVAAENVATALFTAISIINQWDPGRKVLDFFDTLNSQDQATMEAAIHRANALPFFESTASDRWIKASTSALVRRLNG